jgi:hypothetical protein
LVETRVKSALVEARVESSLVESSLVKSAESRLGSDGTSSSNSGTSLTGESVVDDVLGHGGGLYYTLSNVLLNTLNERSWDLAVNDRLDFLNDSWVKGLLNDGLVGDESRAVRWDGLVGVSLNNVDGRSLDLAVNNGLYLNDLLRAGGLLNDGRVDVGLNNSW